MRTRLFAVAAAIAMSFAVASPAGADGRNAVAATTPTGAAVVVSVPGSTTTGYLTGGYRNGGGDSSDVECKFFAAVGTTGASLPDIGPQITDTSAIEPGTPMWLTCRDVTTGVITFQNLFMWDPTDPPLLSPSAASLAQMAANGMVIPVPGVQTWPSSGGRGLVNLPVWLHVDNWATITASASAGGLTATVEAAPVRGEWNMDDDTMTCTDGGRAYDPGMHPDPASSSCSYTYRRSSGIRADQTFHDHVVVVWHLHWTATNGQGGDLGELSSPVVAFDLHIEESQALIAPTGH